VIPAGFRTRGWCRFPAEPATLAWCDAAEPAARRAMAAPEHRDWWRAGGTWFAGVGVLGNDACGRVGDGPPLAGRAASLARALMGADFPGWDPGQVSAVRPGYPRRAPGESEAAFDYRRRRDAAHVDGILPVGPERRRMIGEPHGLVLGIALTDGAPGAAPLAVWEGSHRLIRKALAEALSDVPRENLEKTDISEAYRAARRAAFGTCRRVEVVLRRGEACLLHRHLLHGISPWRAQDGPTGEARIVVYFRPVLAAGAAAWLERD